MLRPRHFALPLALAFGLGSAGLVHAATTAPSQPTPNTYAVTTVIHAKPETVWTLLTNAPGYPTWNPTIEKIDGNIAPGQHIVVFPKFTPGQSFPLDVVAYEANKRMVWVGGMPLGLFKGTRTYTVTPTPDGNVTFVMQEVFTGPLAGMILPKMPNMQPSFDQFGEALKKRAESAS